MTRSLLPFFVLGWGLLGALVAELPAQGPPLSAPEPVRMAAKAFDTQVAIEVRDLARGRSEKAIFAAIREILEVERLTHPDGKLPGSVGALNGAPRGEPMTLDPRVHYLLRRAWDFCVWSLRAHGPLGGQLYDLWGLRQPAIGRPGGEALNRAVESAGCGYLQPNIREPTAILNGESRVDLWGFAQGYAVDRAVAILRDHGARNLWVEVGRVRRALGEGPGGKGWFVALPIVEGQTVPLDELHLQDQALAIVRADEGAFRIAGDRYAPYIDQRTGQPAQEVAATIVVTELAVDAQAMAAAMMIFGNREGQMRLGGLQPPPAVMWLLGSTEGAPLIATSHWSDLRTQ
jgi:thiamine biosynthesis lipoprotein